LNRFNYCSNPKNLMFFFHLAKLGKRFVKKKPPARLAVLSD
jgi:hypothetical protein